jgi:hypothetical protein
LQGVLPGGEPYERFRDERCPYFIQPNRILANLDELDARVAPVDVAPPDCLSLWPFRVNVLHSVTHYVWFGVVFLANYVDKEFDT